MTTLAIDPRYPIGKYEQQPFSIERKVEWLADLKFLPHLMENAVLNLDEAQLHTPYREGGWTVHQLVHHAEMNDVQKLPINISLTLLHALHARWFETLKYVSDDEWNNRTLFHPEHKKTMRLWNVLGNYAWHGKHHVAQITALRERMGW
jgi:uncharacterized damage-inducible protein DinB